MLTHSLRTQHENPRHTRGQGTPMPIVDMHAAVMQDYRRYVQSFLSISDPQIRAFVDQELANGDKFWPDALIQLNPAYREVETVEELAATGLLNPTTAEIFRLSNGNP